LAVDQHNLEASANLRASLNRTSRKRALSASPGYSELDLANLMARHSPTSLQLLGAAAVVANGGSPSSSGSYGQLSGANSPVLAQGLHQASSHLQQLQAHLLRTSPYLSPQNSFIHAASYLPPPVALFGAASTSASNKNEQDPSKEDNNAVVSSTMEDLGGENNLGKKEKRKGKIKAQGKNSIPVQEAATSSSSGFDREDFEEEKDIYETVCHWVNCDKGDFGTQDNLVKHLNNDHVSSNKKSFICQWKNCAREEKPFKAQYMLVVHLRRHTGEKPHCCTFEGCTKAYSRLENLKTHLRSHTGEKPYLCEFPGCAKAFSNASDRAKHQNRTHSNEKPYACKAPGCTKRYTDPSSLRKHVKTVHGAEFYASKRHKGEPHFDNCNSPHPHDSKPENSPTGQQHSRHHPQGSNHKRMNPGAAHTASKLLQSASNHQVAITSSGAPPRNHPSSNPNAPTTSGHTTKSEPDCLPISDNNVSTTANDTLADTETEWDNDADINMAVAAAIGVGDGGDQEEGDVMSSRLANATSRLSGKRSLLRSSSGIPSSNSETLGQSQQQRVQQQGLSEINRSIEKMTLQTMNNGESSSSHSATNKSGCKTTSTSSSRRDSDWTSVSTEDPGYGSMRSDNQVNGSRRCSELSSASQVSNVSTRAVVNSNGGAGAGPGSGVWSESQSQTTSGANSRRSSSANGGDQQANAAGHPQQGARIGQHLSRLHKKAQEHGLRHQQLQHDTGRQSVMSECNTNNPSSSPGLSTNATLAPSTGYGGRRASDPVRVLDRNFGVGGPHHIQSRHRSGSYAGGQQQHAENNHNYQVAPSKNSGAGNSYQHYPPPESGFHQPGSFAGFQPPASGTGTPATQAAQWQAFNDFHQGFPPSNYNYSHFNPAQQNQQQLAPPGGPHQNHHQNWPASNHAQQQWNNWNYYGQQQQNGAQAGQQLAPPPPLGGATAPGGAAAVGPSGENSASYQRTLEYVQQCQQQSWSANNQPQ